MSETYSIWHSERPEGDAWTLYLTAINVQELGSGSDEFVSLLLSNLGAEDSTTPDWRLSGPVAVDHLSSQRTDDWRDTWLLTWKLSLSTAAGAELPVDPIDLTIWDESWDGTEAAPEAFEVVATGEGVPPKLDEDGASFGRCSLGHFHVRVPVKNGQVDAAAERAAEVEERLSDAGWATTWR